jgi:pimeloyl-ACP methyl ester carboxylesterase
MSQPTKITERAVDVANGRIKLRFKVGGEGPPLIYFHAAGGLLWDPFLFRMAEHYTVYAPEFPGTSAGDPYAIHQIDDVWDAVLAYEEAIRGLGLDQPPVAIAQSFGGMLSLEVSASYPGIFAKHVVLDPVGLWREDAPVSNWMEASPPALAAMLFKDPSSPAAQAMLTLPEDPEAAVKAQAALVWALGCTGKLCWPIPDRGLHKRLHRIKTPTLIVWGADDGLAPVVYAEEFHRRIAGSQVAIVPNSGHIPEVEQLDTTLDLVRRFLEKSE